MATGIYLLVVFLFSVARAAEWNHNLDDYDKGPQHWGEAFPTCESDRQSPIQITTSYSEYKRHLKRFEFVGYDDMDQELTLVNNHGAKVNVETNKPRISGGGLGVSYTLQQFHFHSGKDDETGSEHRLDGHGSAGEVHFVHFNDDVDSDQILATDNGIAVLGVLIKSGGANFPENTAYNNVLDHLEYIQYADEETDIPSFNLMDLMPDRLDRYFRYNGSLTTPPCSEAVVWTVFSEHVMLSPRQIEKFRSLKDSDGSPMLNTHRPLQPLKNRWVKASWEASIPGPPITGAASSTIWAQWMITALFASLISVFLH